MTLIHRPTSETFRGYPVLVRSLHIGGRTLELHGPANYDDLPDDPSVVRRFEQDEYLPYWADLWPGALLLAHEVAAWPPQDRKESSPGRAGGPRVVELGCGLGLVSLVAAMRGYHAIATDYDEDSLAFVQRSAAANGLDVETRLVDWRVKYPDLIADRILAADVLYETRNLVPVADFIRNHLSDSAAGFALICDPNRSTAEAFDGVARHSELTVEIIPARTHDPSGRLIEGRIFKASRKL